MKRVSRLQRAILAIVAGAICMAVSSGAWATPKKEDPATTYLRQCVTAVKSFLTANPQDASPPTACNDSRLGVEDMKGVTSSNITAGNGKLKSIKVEMGKRKVAYAEPKGQPRMRPSGHRGSSLTCPGTSTCCAGNLCCKGTFCCRWTGTGAPKCGDGQT